MQSKIFGIPLILILFVIVILGPLIYMNYLVLLQVKNGSEMIMNACVVKPSLAPVATPSASMAPSVAPVKRLIPISPVIKVQ